MPAMTTWRRDSLSQTVEGLPHTFSSWDNCMSKAYCKWPAIIGIVLASLLALSLLWCLARCLCLGTTSCCSCLSCCASCCPRRSAPPSKHADAQPSLFHPAPYQGYQPAPPPPSYEPPQFARFDAGNKPASNDDALPHMPSWDTASERKVPRAERHGDGDVEMGRAGYAEMDAPAYPQQGGNDGRDLGSPYGRQESGGGYGRLHLQQQQQLQAAGARYAGGSAYSAYAPSESTLFEPESGGQGGGGAGFGPGSGTAVAGAGDSMRVGCRWGGRRWGIRGGMFESVGRFTVSIDIFQSVDMVFRVTLCGSVLGSRIGHGRN
ncbi:MAG: hypothetical protein FRX48_02895 [Lasallia pustulata]|uniref:Uncharacterized protein n=1 Tax=Lasallia pustulata TaxID=136370 RepID=A0A5M8PVQ9_9LECA|nr:MAG: hypothetical protein FRX48_02895 [Lasallia pustulata]